MEGSPVNRSGESLLAHAAKLRALAAHLVADSATADDLVQDTLVAALRYAPSVERPLEPWLARVIGNFARKHKRAAVRREDRERALAPLAQVPTPDAIAERLDVQRTLIEALDELEEPFRATLVLHYFEGFSSAEIARLLGVPAGTVRWRHKRGLDELREKLDRRFGGSRAEWAVLFAPLARPILPPIEPTSAAAPAAGTTPGVLVMSAAIKIAGVLAVAAIAGAVWWTLEGPTETPTIGVVHGSEPLAPAPEAPAIDVADGAQPEMAAEPAPARTAGKTAPTPEVQQPETPAEDHARLVVDARFLDPNGTPWSGVHLATLEDGTHGSTQSGADGRARLEFDAFLPAGNWLYFSFKASREGCATVTLGATLRAGEEGHLGDVVLRPAVTLFGRVVDTQGRGIVDARVGFAPPDLGDKDLEHLHRQGAASFEHGTAVPSGADGAFALPGVPAGTWRVWAVAEETRYAWTEPREIQGDRDVYGIELTLSPYRDTDRLAGRVVDPEGRGVPNADLLYFYKAAHESGTIAGQADAEGEFRFVIQRDVDYTIVASDPKGNWSESAVEVAAPGTLDIVLELGARKFVEVTVRDEDEQPIEAADIGCFRENPHRGGASIVERPSRGRARVEIPNYAFSVLVEAPGFRSQKVGPFEPESVSPTLEVKLERLPLVRGRVTAGGKAVADARVGLYRVARNTRHWNGFPCVMEHEAAIEVACDSTGRFEIGCALEDDFYVRASAESWTDAEAGPLSPPRGALDVDLELTHGGAIEGRVILPDGKNAEGAIVGINHGDGRARTLRAGPEGRYRFEGLVPGKWQVVPREEEIRPDTTSVRVEDGGGPEKIPWSCEVAVDRPTYFDLDLTAK